MRGKQYISVLVIALFFTIGLMAAIKPAESSDPYVKVIAPQIPFVAPGGRILIDIIIETSGIADDSAGGIVAWGMDVQLNPASFDLTRYRAKGATYGYFLYEFADWWWYDYPTLLSGIANDTTGYIDDVAESIMPTPPGGAGDPWSGYYLVTLEMKSRSDTIPSVIDLIDVEYKTADGNIYPVDIVVDGYYGTPPPRTMSYQGSLLPPGDPTGTQWHELYPQYCNMWDLVGWTDNTDGDLTVSDQIDMVNETGWTYHFHVDVVLVTIHWTFKSPDVGEGAGEPYETHLIEIGEDSVSGEPEIINPIGSSWHQIYPPEDYCKEFVITSHEDTDGDGNLDISEQFDFEYFGEGVVHWAHLDDITTDIIVSQKGEPEPPVPEFPLGAAVEVGLIVAVAYIWWTRRRKLKEVA